MTIWEDILYPVALISGWSLIYKDNPFWKFFENALVGLGTAITFKIALDTIYNNQILPLTAGKIYPSLVGLIFGLLVMTRLFKSTREYSYIPFGLMAGVGAAIGAQGAIGPQILQQLAFPSFLKEPLLTGLSNFLLFFATLSTMCYFIFSIRRGAVAGTVFGAIGALGRIGRYMMMMGFGVSLATSYIGFGTEYIVYARYVLSSPGIYFTIIGIIILAAEITRSALKARKATAPEKELK